MAWLRQRDTFCTFPVKIALLNEMRDVRERRFLSLLQRARMPRRIYGEGGKIDLMQFIRQKQQVTTCPQCDNVVRVDAEVCNICGKRLKPANGKSQPLAPQTPLPTQPAQPLAAAQSASNVANEVEVEDEDE